MPPVRTTQLIVDSDSEEVLELSSSPPHFIPNSPSKRRVTRASSREASVEVTVPAGTSKINATNGKKPRKKHKLRAVIELSDSDDDEGIGYTPNAKGKAKAQPVQELESARTPPPASSSKSKLHSEVQESTNGHMRTKKALFLASTDDEDDDEMLGRSLGDDQRKRKVRMQPLSLRDSVKSPRKPEPEPTEDMDEDMRKAIALSLEENDQRIRNEAARRTAETSYFGGKGKDREREPDVDTFEAQPNHLDQPPSTVPSSPRTTALINILEIIPNIQPEYLQNRIETEIAAEVARAADAESQQREDGGGDVTGQIQVDGVRIAQHLVGILLEEGGWPKVERGKGKGKATDEVSKSGAKRKSDAAGLDASCSGQKKARVEWKNPNRPWEGGASYIDLALIYLQTSFPLIPKPYLRRRLQENKSHYAPTHIALRVDEEAGAQRYAPKATPYHASRDRTKANRNGWQDPILEEEKRWVEEWEKDRDDDPKLETQSSNQPAQQSAPEQAEDDDADPPEGEGAQCQCCYTDYYFVKMVQCPESHLFCRGCISTYAATQLGEHNIKIVCMHESGCGQPFPSSELRRVLTTKLMELYDRIEQRKEIEQAGLDGLEECPFCDYKCVIDQPFEEEKLFRCRNEDGDCGIVSCRKCKKEDHLPKSCEEADEDKHLDGQHAVEEAMTRALMRNCPKCNKPFIKEAGCNKMSCPNCRALSCYVCRSIITGYDHFDQGAPAQPGSSRSSGKCPLSDSVEQRHVDEVKEAAEKAMAQLKELHPEADANKIKIDLPTAPPPPAPYPPVFNPPQYVGVNMNNAFNVGAWGNPGGVPNPFLNLHPALPLPPAPARGRRGRVPHPQQLVAPPPAIPRPQVRNGRGRRRGARP